LIGNYLFQGQSGASIIDTTGSLGTAYFGSSTPTLIDTINSPRWIGTVERSFVKISGLILSF